MPGPTVTLTFAGDTEKLTKAMDGVGASSKSMSEKITSGSNTLGDSVRKTGTDVDGLRDKAGKGELGFIGFRDTITGAGEAMTSVRNGDMLGFAAGMGDIAGGLENFLIPAVAGLATVLKVGLGGALTFIAAHPIVIAILLLIALIVLLWVHSEGFRNAVIQIWNDIWAKVEGFIKDFRQGWDDLWAKIEGFIQNLRSIWDNVWSWVEDKVRAVLNFFSTLPERIGGFFQDIGQKIRNAFGTAVQWVKDKWNDTIGGFGFTMPDWLGGGDIRIPRLHQGGIVPGTPGSETLALLQAGERVTPAGQVPSSSGGGAMVLTAGPGAGNAVATMIAELIRTGQLSLAPAA